MSDQQAIRNILFVCTGNLCRSPMAEGFLIKRLREEGISDIEVLSAGTIGIEGRPASEGAVKVAGEHGFNIEGHSARPLTPSLIRWADFIVVMEQAQRDEVVWMDPSAKGKVFLLLDFSNLSASGESVRDPYGQDLQAYRLAFEEIKEGVEGLLDLIKKRRLERFVGISHKPRDPGANQLP